MNRKPIITKQELDTLVRAGLVTSKSESLIRDAIRKYNSFFRSTENKTRSYFIARLAIFINRSITEDQFLFLVDQIPLSDAFEATECSGWIICEGELTGKMLSSPIPGPYLVRTAVVGTKYPRSNCMHFTKDGRKLSLEAIEGPIDDNYYIIP